MRKSAVNIFVTITVCTSQAYSLTLLEAIKASLQGNKKMVANTLRLEAAEENTKAARLNWVPTVSLSANTSVMQRDQGQSLKSHGTGVTTSISLYDGGARKQNLIATESEFKAANERFNSVSYTGGNTRASIAGDVLEAYITILTLLEGKNQIQFNDATLNLFLSATTVETEQVMIQQQLTGLKKQAVNLDFQLRRVKEQFKNAASIELPPYDQLQSFDLAIASLEIPSNADEAFRIALEKNPSIRVAEQDVITSEARNKALRAGQGPQISANASVNRNSGLYNSGTVKNIGVTLSMNLDVKSGHYRSASDKFLAAAISDRDGIIDDRKFMIYDIYPSLENQLETFNLDIEAQNAAKLKLQTVIEKIKSGKPVNMMDEALFSLGTYNQYQQTTSQSRTHILNTKYRIQQTVGTFFEKLGIQAKP